MQSLSRALSLLTTLAGRSDGATLTELAAGAGLHKSTVHRMLVTFTEHDLVRRDPANRYWVGLGALELARAACGEDRDAAVIARVLAPLSLRWRVSATYFAVTGTGLAAVATVREGRDLPLRAHPVAPTHAGAAGKVYLSTLPARVLDRELDRPLTACTPRTVIDPLQLRQMLTKVRMRGYAVEDREVTMHRRALAVPVADHAGGVVGVVEATLPAGPCQTDRVRALAAALFEIAESLIAEVAGVEAMEQTVSAGVGA